MADTRDFLLEEIQHLLKDVEFYLSTTLKKEKLKKEVGMKREELSKQVASLINKVDKVLPKDEQEEYADVEVESPVAPIEEDDGELYEDTVATAPDSPNKNALSQGSDHDTLEEPEPPEASERDENGEPYGDMKIGPIAATDLLKPTMEGFLEKRRKEGQIGLQQWQRRYCVIKENIFYYFKNRNDKQQKNVIVLNGYEARPNPDFDKKHKKRDFLFEVVCPAKRSFQFIAQSTEEMKAWIDAIAIASKVLPAIEASMKSTAPDPSNNSPLKEFSSKDEIPEDFGDTYEDVDTYQRSKVGKAPEAVVQPTETTSLIYDDTEIIETEEVYEDVAGKDSEGPQLPPARQGGLPQIPQPQPTQPKFKLPAIPTSDRPKPEPPTKQSEEDKPTLPARRGDDKSPALPKVPSPASQEPAVPLVPSKPELWEEDYENIYLGMWDCNADDDDELSFKRGDLVHILSREYDSFNWWVGEKNSKVGLVPKDYLMQAYLL
ncbi:src kinase-associated phosphoprotein 2-like [Diadema antillarum]|uniref:src kinase-associated phosphoprotein 2-like n=1 Tax=Diadema antillarum TaxID=105358 RepID=UPI003A89DEB1